MVIEEDDFNIKTTKSSFFKKKTKTHPVTNNSNTLIDGPKSALVQNSSDIDE